MRKKQVNISSDKRFVLLSRRAMLKYCRRRKARQASTTTTRFEHRDTHRKFPTSAYSIARSAPQFVRGNWRASSFPFYFLIRCLTPTRCGNARSRSRATSPRWYKRSSSFHFVPRFMGHVATLRHTGPTAADPAGNERDLQANHNRREKSMRFIAK